ncbi:MAG: hypothetical protein ACRC3Y_04060, partial [Romboutsia sp.]|uniref:hypothetical protein n=1 Tax=Romboutsia sp. TaxID=1965302 RepID=UPI003F2F53C9
MDKHNNEEFDFKIKEALKDNDKIAVPEKISKGIDETLQGLENKRSYPIKKITMIASVCMILLLMAISPKGIDAIKAMKDAIYT